MANYSFTLHEINWYCLILMNKLNIPHGINNFYKCTCILKEWSKHFTMEPLTVEEVKVQPIWNDCKIKVGNVSPFSKNLFESGIVMVQDLFEKGKFKSWEKLTERGMPLTQIDYLMWLSLKKALPQKWKLLMKENNVDVIYEQDCKIKINNNMTKVENLNSKDVYKSLIVNRVDEPTVKRKWMSYNEINITEDEWEMVYVSIYKTSVDTYSREFQY